MSFSVVLPPAARSLPPVAHASGSHTLALPNNSLVLRGSVTDGDQTEVHYLWVRDSQSPAAGVSTDHSYRKSKTVDQIKEDYIT